MSELVDVTLRRFPKSKLRQLKALAASEGAGRSNNTVIEWAVTQFIKLSKNEAQPARRAGRQSVDPSPA